MASNEITHRGSTDIDCVRGSATADRTTESGSGDGGVSVRAADVESVVSPAGSQYRLLVPVPRGGDIDELERIVRTAATIARYQEGDLLLLCLVDVPRQTPYEAITSDLPRVEEVHEAAERLLGAAKRMDVGANAVVVLTHQETRSIVDAAARHDCDGVFMPVDGDRSQRWRLLASAVVETVVSRADADVFVEKVGTRETSIDRILLAVSDGPHSERATETARAHASTSFT